MPGMGNGDIGRRQLRPFASGGVRAPASGIRPLDVAVAAAVVVLSVLATAVVATLPTPSPLIVAGVLVGLALPIWLATTRRLGLALIILLLYLGLADGVIKLTTGSPVATLGRDVLLYAITIGALVRLLALRRPIVLPPLSGWVIAFSAVVLIQLVGPESNGLAHSVASLRQHLEFVPLFFLGYAMVQSGDRLRTFMWGLVVVAAINGLAGFIQIQLTPDQLSSWGPGYQALIHGTGDVSARLAFDTQGDFFGVRPFALGSDSGFGGILGMLAIPAVLALFSTTRRPSLLVVLSVLSVGVAAGVATSQARVAIVGSVIAALAYLALVVSTRRGLSTVLAVGLAGLATVVVISGVQNAAAGDAFARLDGITPDKVLQTTFDYRQDTFSLLPTYVREYPFGAGLGTVGPASATLSATDAIELDGESQPSFLLIELGVIGAVVFIAFNLRLLLLAVRCRRLKDDLRPLMAAVGAPLFAIFATGFVGATSTSTPAAPYFWFAAGILAYWLAAPRRSRADDGAGP